MPVKKKSLRFAHIEGHTDLCYDDTGSHLLTCGSDGDVRIWEGLDDDDPISHRAGDSVNVVAYKNGKFYTAGDDNAVKAHTFKEGQPDGILVRFGGQITHMCFNKDGTKLYVCSGEFNIKVVETETRTQKTIPGHDAPVLSLALHPKETLLASSGCDGTVRIWDPEQLKQIKLLSLLPKTNDFSLSQTLCRMAWTKDGKKLLIPVGQEIHAYNSDTWEKEFVLKDPEIKEVVSLVSLSPCGRYLATACRNGFLLIWDLNINKCVNRDYHEKKLTITALVWNPQGNHHLAFCDNQGNLGLMEGVVPDIEQAMENNGDAAQFSDLFDDVDDDMMLQASVNAVEGGGEGLAKLNPLAESDDDDDDGMPGLHKRQKALRIDDDDNSRDTDFGSMKPDDDADSMMDTAPVALTRPLPPRAPEATPLQKAFQPSATPAHLSHRFMVWNFIGIVRQYNTEEENSIDVEFHNTATHHPLHVTNTLGHTMAALSQEAVLLACESDGEEDIPSKLVCMHFGSWDSCKEWSVSMPDGEDIIAMTLGQGWLAVATDTRQVRMFTVGGLQRETFTMPGPVVAMAAHGAQLLIVYHKGVGLPGDQNLGVMLLRVSGRCKAVVKEEPLPIAHKSTLAWLGFSVEGTPVAVDTSGLVYMMNRKFANTWTQVANLKHSAKGKSDNYFVLGVQENPSQIRCILVKGGRYPPTLPRPNVSLLQFQVPLCESSTEKGQLEEKYWRSVLTTNYFDFWSAEGYECDEADKAQALLPQQETLMKMFALACKMQREVRAMEICELMPTQHTVQLAIKYATRMRMTQLAQRLTDVARRKAEEELAAQVDDEEEEYVLPIRSRKPPVMNGHASVSMQPGQTEEQEEEMEAEDEEETGGDIYEEIDEQDEEEENKHKGPMLKFKPKEEKTPKSLLNSQSGQKKNPFKVGSQTTPTGSVRGSSVFDNIQRPASASKVLSVRSPQDRPKQSAVAKKKGMTQSIIFGAKKPEKIQEKLTPGKKGGKTGFQLWFEAHKEEIVEEHPDLAEADLTMVAAKSFKALNDNDKKEWNDKAKLSDSNEERKRKRSDQDAIAGSENIATKEQKTSDNNAAAAAAAKKKKPLSQATNSKLSNFSFGK